MLPVYLLMGILLLNIIIEAHSFFVARKFFLSSRMNSPFFIFVLAALEILIAVLLFSGKVYMETTSISQDDSLSDRISVISSSLATTSGELSNVQKELEERIEFVQNLKREAEIAENVISLSDEQINAVQAKLNQELEASSGKNTVTNILISTFFFVLGLFANQIVAKIKQKRPSQNDEQVLDRRMYSLDEVLAILERAKEDIENATEPQI